MNYRGKIIAIDALADWRDAIEKQGKRLVVTNGCFDLLHVGHVSYLETARNYGDALLVGVNGDASVRLLKGAGRPINSEADRADVLAALEAVDGVCVFPEQRATRFLALARPDVYAKGGDYSIQTLDPEERAIVGKCKSRIEIIRMVPGKSTTNLLEQIAPISK